MSGTIYHLISRFTDRTWFIQSNVERHGYLTVLGEAMRHSDWRCFSFAIMSSHIHLGVVAGESSLASWLRPMHTDFARWINDRRGRIGAVFVKRRDPIAVMPAGTARLINYIHNNPVRAGVVSRADQSDWTSHRAYRDPGRRPRWLDVELGCALAEMDRVSLATWVESTAIDRDALDEVRVVPRPRIGRPPRTKSDFVSECG